MIIKEFIAKDTQNKNRNYLEIECDHCKSTYVRLKHVFKTKIHGCSPKCLAYLKGEVVTTNCAHCNAIIEKKKSEIKKSKSGLQFCNRQCKEEAQKYMPEIQPLHYGSGSGKHDYRERALKHYGVKCTKCGFDNILAIDVHHIDEDRDNNVIENLEVLCCNCHAIHHRGSYKNSTDPCKIG